MGHEAGGVRRRRFTARQRHIAALFTDIEDGEADHIVPYARGGETVIENLQMVPASVNRRKGAFVFTPRQWQRAFIQEWQKRPERRPFLLVAIPGGGKTMAALEVARQWIAAASDRRLVVVVPSANLQQQWRDEAGQFGLELQTTEFGTNFKHGFQGGVATYQKVASEPYLFRKLCSVSPTMVIFDEVHHCGEKQSFGRAIRDAFELSKEVLAMSGTPWKTDGEAIPFVRYDANGFPIADFTYDYPHAIRDNVVRYLVFDHARGRLTNTETGVVRTLDTDVSEEEASWLLGKLLDADGEYVRGLIADAHTKLMDIREQTPDAAALAVCVDQIHARRVRQAILEITGCDAGLIVSDEETDTVQQFRRSRKEWLVSVKKVSEGTDIKRLQVLCYLTNVTTDLFFRQVVGRVSRVRNDEEVEEGYVYLPADPRLVQCAKNIEDAQTRALAAEDENDDRAPREMGERIGVDPWSFTTEHGGTSCVLIGAERVSAEDAARYEHASRVAGVPIHQVRAVEQALQGIGVAPPRAAAPAVGQPGLEERQQKLRGKCRNAAFRLAKILESRGDGLVSDIVKRIHGGYSPRQELMTESQLEAKLANLRARIEEAMRATQ